jgi:hypothetical protein
LTEGSAGLFSANTGALLVPLLSVFVFVDSRLVVPVLLLLLVENVTDLDGKVAVSDVTDLRVVDSRLVPLLLLLLVEDVTDLDVEVAVSDVTDLRVVDSRLVPLLLLLLVEGVIDLDVEVAVSDVTDLDVDIATDIATLGVKLPGLVPRIGGRIRPRLFQSDLREDTSEGEFLLSGGDAAEKRDRDNCEKPAMT